MQPIRNFIPKDTSRIQETSLVRFAEAMGYSPVYDPKDRLKSFRNPEFDRTGSGRISVLNMIALHNDEDYNNEAFQFIRSFNDFEELVNFNDTVGHSLIAVMFAHSAKIVKRVKATYSRKRRFHVQDHNIKFASNACYTKSYQNYLEGK
jgi:hypothetical protein